MNNPFQILQATRNPEVLVDMMMRGPAASDARVRKVCELYKKHDTAGLERMANNLCQEYNTTPDQMRQNLAGFLRM